MAEINNTSFSIRAEMLQSVNYSLLSTKMHIVQFIEVTNHSESAIEGLCLQISSDSDLIESNSRVIDYIEASDTVTITDFEPKFDPSKIAELTEKINISLKFTLSLGEEVLCEQTFEMTILAFDEWCGSEIFPETLASFSMPNCSSVNTILQRASILLQSWTDDPSLDAYQTMDPNRVLKQAAAIYNAIKEQNIAYCVAPASFETTGQRIRLTDTLVDQKLGNCLDMTMCYCSCLEAAGLHPIVLVLKNHAFAGVWLEDKTFSETILYDSSQITKRLADGINEIAVVECTAMNAGNNATFETAANEAEKKLVELSDIEYILDIKRARLSGITPLPVRIKTEDGYIVIRENLKPNNSVEQPQEVYSGIIQTGDAPAEFTKKTLWERKLLDLGLRNQLINLRQSKTLVPMLSASLDSLEDTLYDGAEFSILSRPEDFHITDKDISFDKIHELIPNKEFLATEFKNHRLRSALSDTELSKTLKELYRSSKSSLEENGANTLYMAFGLLRWYENEKSVKPRYAPLVLVPVELVRKSASSNYTLRMRDDESQINVTILEKLKQDFKIQINGLDPLPLDEHGIDLKSVFTIIRKEIMDYPHWDVLESSYIGIFTFSQFVMWNDIRNRSEDLEKNKVVKSLVEGYLTWDAESMEIPDEVNVDNVLLPISADASQAFAIKEAAEGKSFVLHGPPGTGKSQTITALIANALASGKTVLFVAEKMAALSVVEKRLSKLGIGDFCLELHSNKSRKRDVLDQLNQACQISKKSSPEEFSRSAEKLSKLRHELDNYVHSLHKKTASGLSCFDFINMYEANIDAPDCINLNGASFIKYDAAKYEECNDAVDSLISAALPLGHPSTHPLNRIKATEYSQNLKNSIVPAAENYKKCVQNHKDSLSVFLDRCDLNGISSTEDISTYSKLCDNLNEWYKYPDEWSKAQNATTYFAGLDEYCNKNISMLNSQNEILKNWNESFLEINASSMLTSYQEAIGSFFIAKPFKLHSIKKQLAFCTKTKINTDTLGNELTYLMKYQKIKADIETLTPNYAAGIAKLSHESVSDWNTIKSMITSAQKLYDDINALGLSYDFNANCAGNPSFKSDIENIKVAKEALDTSMNSLYALTKANKPAATDDFYSMELTHCNNILANSDSLKDIILWNNAVEHLNALNLGDLAQSYMRGLSHNDVLPVYKKALSSAYVSYICDNDSTLSTFSDALFNDKIRQFKEIDSKVMDLTKKEIFAKLAAKIPNFQVAAAQSSETGILQRAIKSGGRGTSIRKLFSQIPNLLPRIAPCMLMSPMSAAQYLDPATELFDLVVFDEASQLPTSKAVGAIARGKNTIVVGDPKQMPPTSFFMSDSLDEDNLDTEDLESILDDCLALEMPQTHLLWHYRSRHESLIAFSNNMFYENKLYTFPSANDRESKVTLVPVDGFFDRGKTRQNRAEAEAIVAEIKRRCYDDTLNTFSIGVVTFNISQTNLIDDLVTAACSEDPVLENWLYNQDEPLFIKNLENVQGDERDVILFSVGYGADKDGKVYMNFGPLNRDGGWRRLNVAVSRARCEMMVFSTLEPEQINLSKTSAEGVAALKNFLEYAKKGTLRDSRNSSTSRNISAEGTIASICTELKNAGYDTAINIGHSAYRVDIGIIDPLDSNRYLAGILLDGDVYASAQLTRDRELSQISVLEGLGWNITRVWSVSWWDNKKRELDNLIKFLDDVKSGERKTIATGSNEARPLTNTQKTDSASSVTESIQEVTENIDSSSIEEDSVPSQNTLVESNMSSEPKTNGSAITYKEYVPYEQPVDVISTEDFLKQSTATKIKKIIEDYVNQEAPILRTTAEKKILTACGFTRPNPKVIAHLNSLIDALNFETTPQGEETIIWSKAVTPTNINFFRTSLSTSPYRRDIKDIAIQEIEQAVIYVVDSQISLSIEDLNREVSKLFGFTRISEKGKPYIAAAIKCAIIDDILKIDVNEKISLK